MINLPMVYLYISIVEIGAAVFVETSIPGKIFAHIHILLQLLVPIDSEWLETSTNHKNKKSFFFAKT